MHKKQQGRERERKGQKSGRGKEEEKGGKDGGMEEEEHMPSASGEGGFLN